jgi:hypothetical protein
MIQKREGFLLLDLLKVMTLLAIQILHVWEFTFYEDELILPGSILFQPFLQYYARVFSLGGQVLVAVIYLLFGLTEKTKTSLIKIAGFAVFGQIALALAFMEDGKPSFEWDIYSFIFFTNLLLLFLPRGKIYLIVVSFIILWVSPSVWKEIIPENLLTDILVGRRGDFSTGAWAIMPWFFHALLFFNLGTLIRRKVIDMSEWNRAETLIWPVLFTFSIPFLGFYFPTPIGPNYYFFNFHQTMPVYWANFLFFLFWIRLAFLEKLKAKLETKRILRWISSLMWTRQLGLCYVTAVLYVGLSAQYEEFFRSSPLAFDALALSVMPVSEIIVRILIKLVPKKK